MLARRIYRAALCGHRGSAAILQGLIRFPIEPPTNLAGINGSSVSLKSQIKYSQIIHAQAPNLIREGTSGSCLLGYPLGLLALSVDYNASVARTFTSIILEQRCRFSTLQTSYR